MNESPSYQNGFAPRDGEPRELDLWTGCVGSWSSLLGPTGATLFDQSGRVGNADFTGMTPAEAWAVDQQGYVINANASGRYITVPMVYSAPYTISTWCRWSGNNSNYQVLWYHGDAAANGVGLLINVGTGLLELLHGGVAFVLSLGSIPTAQWINVTLTATSAATYVGYIDGKQVSTTTSAGPYTPTSTLYVIGNYAVNQHWNGLLSTVSKWDRVLSPNEITLLAQRPGIMYELDDDDVWGAVEAGGSVPWWAFANRQSRIIGGGVT